MKTLTALFYEYVEDIVERRTPHRDAHLALANDWHSSGRLLQIGVLGDPPRGALIVFELDDPAEAQEFIDADPYISAGLVTSHRVEPWKVVDLG